MTVILFDREDMDIWVKCGMTAGPERRLLSIDVKGLTKW